VSRRFRLALVGIACVAAAAGTVGYLVLVLSTAKAPPSVALSAPPSLHASSVTATTFTGAEGPWVVAPGGQGGFVGYRAREILGFDFVQSPNEAVARTTDVSGRISIAGTTLQAAEIKANVASLQSDIDVRDGHIHEFLLLDSHPDATFRLTAPVDIGTPTRGRVVKVKASGDLTILDATKQVAFPLETRWNGDSIEIAGQLLIKRSDYNMDIPQLLGFRVSEEITLELQLVLVRPCVEPCATPRGSSPSASPPTEPSNPPPSVYPPSDVAAGKLPDGWGEIAFLGLNNRGGDQSPDGDIYVIGGGSSRERRLTDTPQYLEDEPAWSRDGKRIAYPRSPNNAPPEIWVMNADGSGQRALTTAALTSPVWSPDGKRIVALPASDQQSNLALVDTTTGELGRLVDDPGVEDSPDWSPDGRHIVFSLLPKGGTNQDLYVINADGTGLRRLTEDPGYEYSLRWSPNGQRIAFVREGDLWVMDENGSHPEMLTSGLRADDPTWSPDARHIAFVLAGRALELDPVRQSIWIIDADGSSPRRLTFDFDQVAHPAWRP
jgi:polyisoprenoid-binding protein YceI